MRHDILQKAARCLWRSAAASYDRAFSASIRPTDSVYGGPRVPKRVTLRSIREKFRQGKAFSMVTAYDYPSAVHVEHTEIDFLLVGDSVSMVVHGHDTTLPVTLNDMILHCQAVTRGATRPYIIGDLPFGSYEQSSQQAVASATRIMKEGKVDAVKMEGGTSTRVATAHSLTEAGIAVMGHIGLAPQMISVIGGFSPQALVAEKAMETIEQGKSLQTAGCFALVLECVPAAVGAAVQTALDIPVIGIGAGPACAGQVLVFHDMLGYIQHPHHAKVMPKFCKRYCEVGQMITQALIEYDKEVKTREFPGKQYSPYKIDGAEVNKFCASLKEAGMDTAAKAVRTLYDEHHSGGSN